MALRRRSAAAGAGVLLLLAVLTSGCDGNGSLLPDLPSNGICCEVASAVPQSLLRLTAKDFKGAQTLCSQEKTSWQFTIFTGYDTPGGGGGGGGGGLSPASFGCASTSEPACLKRDVSACSPACLRAKKCFLRFPSDTPFIVESEERRKTKTKSNAVIVSSGSIATSEQKEGENGETTRTNVTEARQGRLNISSTENKDSRFRGVNINSKSLPSIGDSILRSGPGLRPNPSSRLGGLMGTDRPSISVFASGSGAASETRRGEGYCCRLTGTEAPQPLPGVTNLVDSETQCRTKQIGLAVRINSEKWGCGGDSFKSQCDQLKTCDGCLADDSCMIVYRVSLAVTIETVRSQLSGSRFDVARVGRDQRTDTMQREIGGGIRLTGSRSLRNLTVEDVIGSKQTRRESQENKRISSEVGPDGNVRGGVTVEAAITITGTASTNRSTSQQTSDRGRQVITTNLTRPGEQEGLRRQSEDRDVTRNRDAAVLTTETSKDVNRTASSSGDKRAELLPGLRSPRDGSASLSAGDRNVSRVGQESVITSTVERTNDNSNIRTTGGDQSRQAVSTATVRTDAERTGARNDSNIRTTAFVTEDKQLGKVELSRRDVSSGAVVDRASASGARTASSSRTVTTCASCNSTTDLEERSRGDRQNQTTAHIESVKRDVTKTTRVSSDSPLPALTVTARDIREAKTEDAISRGAGTTQNTTLLNTQRTGFQSSRNRTVLSVEKTNGTDHVEEVKKTTVVRAVTR